MQTEVSLEKVKLSHRERLPLVHRRSLSGIAIDRVDRTDFQHPFDSEVAFYRIEQGEDWYEALKHDSIAFYSTPELLLARPSLYWRGE
jgi:predicted component of type VI protein secretion system